MCVQLDDLQSSLGFPWSLVPCGTVMVMFSVDGDAVGALCRLRKQSQSHAQKQEKCDRHIAFFRTTVAPSNRHRLLSKVPTLTTPIVSAMEDEVVWKMTASLPYRHISRTGCRNRVLHCAIIVILSAAESLHIRHWSEPSAHVLSLRSSKDCLSIKTM